MVVINTYIFRSCDTLNIKCLVLEYLYIPCGIGEGHPQLVVYKSWKQYANAVSLSCLKGWWSAKISKAPVSVQEILGE